MCNDRPEKKNLSHLQWFMCGGYTLSRYINISTHVYIFLSEWSGYNDVMFSIWDSPMISLSASFFSFASEKKKEGCIYWLWHFFTSIMLSSFLFSVFSIHFLYISLGWRLGRNFCVQIPSSFLFLFFHGEVYFLNHWGNTFVTCMERRWRKKREWKERMRFFFSSCFPIVSVGFFYLCKHFLPRLAHICISKHMDELDKWMNAEEFCMNGESLLLHEKQASNAKQIERVIKKKKVFSLSLLVNSRNDTLFCKYASYTTCEMNGSMYLSHWINKEKKNSSRVVFICVRERVGAGSFFVCLLHKVQQNIVAKAGLFNKVVGDGGGFFVGGRQVNTFGEWESFHTFHA